MFHFDEAFWVAAAFFAFIGLMIKPLYLAITNGLDNRSARIKKELHEAMRLKEEAQALLASYQRKKRKAIDEAEEIIAHANAEADRIIAAAARRIEGELTKRTELAVQKIAQAEALVVQEIRENAVDITISAARTLIVDNLSREAAEEIMRNAVENINRKFH